MERLILYMGSHGEGVGVLKRILTALDYRISEQTSGFDINTRSAVEAFQNDNKLEINGVVDGITWDALAKRCSEMNIVFEEASIIAEVQEMESETTPDEIPAEALAETPETSSAITARPTLRQGDRNAYVTELQDALRSLGYFNGQADGIFGPVTESAVRAFQAAENLSIDGIAGKDTWEAIGSASSVPPAAAPITEKPVLRIGDSGAYVTSLQTSLKQLNFYHGRIDGKFGSGTDTAVRNFQDSAGLNSDGIVGKATWDAIENALIEFIPEGPAIGEGSTGAQVSILQEKLKLLGFFSGSVTGSFGTETAAAVKAFQKANGLIADGAMDTKTLEMLYRQTDYPPVTKPLSEGPRPTLRFGDSGAFVMVLQRDLTSLLYYDGPISGILDRETQVSVKVFQDANRLTPDGIVGHSTWHALYELYPPPVEC